MVNHRRILWSNDRRHGKSSIEVTLDWLAEGNNLGRWQSGVEQKKCLSKEIARLLHAQELQHRTDLQVQCMVRSILRSLAKAKKLLEQENLEGATTLDACEGALRDEILKVCPYFEKLAVLMPRLAEPVPTSGRTSSRARAQAEPAMTHPEDTPDTAAQTGSTRVTRAAEAAARAASIGDDTPAPDCADDQSPGLLELQRLLLQDQYEHQRKIHKIELEQCKSNLLVDRALKRAKLDQAKIPDSSVLPHAEYESNWEAFW